MDKPDGPRIDWEVAKLLLEEIKIEQQSMDARVSTYHTSQSFLFAAYAISSLGEHKHHQAIHWFSNYVVPGIGILFSLLMFLAVYQAQARLIALYASLRKRVNQMGGTPTGDIAEDFCLPSLSARKRAMLYSKWAPVICGIAWFYVGLHSVWYEFVTKEVPTHQGSSTGSAGSGHGSHEDEASPPDHEQQEKAK